MDPISGGGPRNVFTLSRLLNESGLSTNILAFRSMRSMQFLYHILGQRVVNDFFGAKRIEPNRLLSLIYTFTSIGNNLNAFLYPIFTFNQFILNPLMISRYSIPDIYIATNWQSFTPTLKVSKKYNIPIMYFVQADETEFSNNPVYKKEATKTYRNQVKKFTQSKWLVDEFENKFNIKLNYIGFGIEHNTFYPREWRLDKIIFTIARTEPTKGFHIFVNAVNRLWKIRQDFKVIIAGSRAAVNTRFIYFPFEFLGWVNNDELLAEIYSRSIFVNTGLKEALPMPPLEAMACGGCVVMSANGGSVEYAKDWENCLLTRPGNDKELTETLNFILSSESTRESVRVKAIKTAKEYVWAKVIDNFSSIIDGDI